MGAKAKKALKKKLKKTSQLSISQYKNESSDFLPLEGGPGQKLAKVEEPVKNTATVLYIGHIPHGFYEEQMKGFFCQFGKIKNLRIARSRKVHFFPCYICWADDFTVLSLMEECCQGITYEGKTYQTW